MTALWKMPSQRAEGGGSPQPVPVGETDTADNLRPQGYLGNALRTWLRNASSDVEQALLWSRDPDSSSDPLAGTG